MTECLGNYREWDRGCPSGCGILIGMKMKFTRRLLRAGIGDDLSLARLNPKGTLVFRMDLV